MMLRSRLMFRVRDRRRIAPFGGLLMGLNISVSAGAHDFWVQPADYWLKPQIASSLTLQVGHGQFRQRSPIPLSRITRFEAIGPDGVAVDLRDNLHVGGGSDDGALRFSKP